jgi:FtsH-binding integral membrane protein
MSDYRGFPQSGARTGAAMDMGLRSYMQRVYNYMALGLGVTGLAAAAVLTTGIAPVLFGTPLKWLVLFAPLAMVMYLSFRIHTMTVAGAQMAFWIYAALVGISLAPLAMVYTGASLAQSFFVTAATFASLSLYGYTTKRDLTGFGSFLFMGLIGLIIASLVNLFLMNSAVSFALSVLSVLIFTGLTAYDTQRIKALYYEGDGEVTMGHKAIMGALTLYLDFINLFISLLRIMGDRR